MDRVQALAVLGLRCNFSDAELRYTYFTLARMHHPDRNPGDVQASGEMMRRINLAHEVLEAWQAEPAVAPMPEPRAGAPTPQPELSGASHNAALQLMQYLTSLPRGHADRAVAGILLAKIGTSLPPPEVRTGPGCLTDWTIDDQDRDWHTLRLIRGVCDIPLPPPWPLPLQSKAAPRGVDADAGAPLVGISTTLVSASQESPSIEATWASLDMWYEPKSDHQYGRVSAATAFSSYWNSLTERCHRSCAMVSASSADSSTCSTSTLQPAP